MCSCQHPVPGQQGSPTEVGPIITQADLPWPPSQAAVLAPHNAIHWQFSAATVCGEVTRKAQNWGIGFQGIVCLWGWEETQPCPSSSWEQGGLSLTLDMWRSWAVCGDTPPWGPRAPVLACI